MDKRLERILPRVQKPARYVGGEYNAVLKDKAAVDTRIAFCFPDTYEIGMSNLGMRILYGVMNEMDGVWCERVFAPWGDMEEEGTPLDGRELRTYEGDILAALVKNRMPEETERGIMHWYGKNDSVDDKVRSVVFTAEERNGQLWGVAECRVVGTLTPEELDTLKEYVSGQASDGWGEGFEQREIEADGGELYVHLWNWNNWSIQTEEERFSPKIAEGLPELCFSTILTTGELICIKRGETGYYPSDWDTGDKERNVELADQLNEQLGVTMWQRKAMEVGSMCGWGCPGADPAKYLEDFQPKTGGLTLE